MSILKSRQTAPLETLYRERNKQVNNLNSMNRKCERMCCSYAIHILSVNFGLKTQRAVNSVTKEIIK